MFRKSIEFSLSSEKKKILFAQTFTVDRILPPPTPDKGSKRTNCWLIQIRRRVFTQMSEWRWEAFLKSLEQKRIREDWFLQGNATLQEMFRFSVKKEKKKKPSTPDVALFSFFFFLKKGGKKRKKKSQNGFLKRSRWSGTIAKGGRCFICPQLLSPSISQTINCTCLERERVNGRRFGPNLARSVKFRLLSNFF